MYFLFLRYVNTVMVEDLQTEQKWHFLCSSWLAVDIDDCTVEKVFPVASETDMKGFRWVHYLAISFEKEYLKMHLKTFLSAAICSSWRQRRTSVTVTSGTLWSVDPPAVTSPVCSVSPAVSQCCSAPCWPASCSTGFPQTPQSRPWIWVWLKIMT